MTFVKGQEPHNKTHGLATSPEYTAWKNMRSRCYDENSPSYQWYGGKGIGVHPRWATSFENFLEDMGERPSGKTLDRINPTADYSPENCRWATPTEQNYNRTLKRKNKTGERNVNFTANGKKFAAFHIVNKRKVYIGTFETVAEAAAARDAAERKR